MLANTTLFQNMVYATSFCKCNEFGTSKSVAVTRATPDVTDIVASGCTLAGCAAALAGGFSTLPSGALVLLGGCNRCRVHRREDDLANLAWRQDGLNRHDPAMFRDCIDDPILNVGRKRREVAPS